jgi:hypothetical protein
MKVFFQIMFVLLLGFVTAGCMGTGHWEGPRVSQNYPAGSSSYGWLPPSHTTKYYAGSSTGGRVVRYDDGPRHYHHNDYRPQRGYGGGGSSVYVTPAPRVDGLLPNSGGYSHHR